jgi:hypothetical protein
MSSKKAVKPTIDNLLDCIRHGDDEGVKKYMMLRK